MTSSPTPATALTQAFLFLNALGVSLVAFSYGVVPHDVLPRILDLRVESTDLTHVFRAVMGLYVGFSAYWVVAAFRPAWTRGAVLSVVVFMAALAAGRVLSLVVDGLPSPLLLVYLGLEVGVTVIGIWLLARMP